MHHCYGTPTTSHHFIQLVIMFLFTSTLFAITNLKNFFIMSCPTVAALFPKSWLLKINTIILKLGPLTLSSFFFTETSAPPGPLSTFLEIPALKKYYLQKSAFGVWNNKILQHYKNKKFLIISQISI